MRLLTLLFAGAAFAAPATAQQAAPQAGHAAHAAPAPAATPACTPEHAAMGHCKIAPPAPPSSPPCTPEHAAMGHCKITPPAPSAPPTSPPCTPEHAAMGHCTLPPARQADPHAGHGASPVAGAVDPPVAPPPPEAFSGPANAADLFWDSRAMARSRREMRREHGALPAYRVLVDQLETRVRDGADGLHLEADAWFGGDIDKIWFKAEAEGEAGDLFEEAELQALWSHAIDPWFDLQTGVRYDPQPGSDRAYLVAGVQGLAPYWIEIDAAAFLSDKGDVTARLEAEHDVRITQQLILQPRVELDLALQDVPEEAIGAGVSTVSLGARLRYQFRPEFAPYVGVHYGRAFGDSRDFRRLAGEDLGGVSLLAGLRTWF